MSTRGAPASSLPPEGIARRVREECVRVALDAYEDAGIRGLCTEGRWEAAVDAMRLLDTSVLLQRLSERVAAEGNESVGAGDDEG